MDNSPPKSIHNSDVSKLESFANCLNFMMAYMSVNYGDEEDFCKDALESCLSDNIVSKKVADDVLFEDKSKEKVEVEYVNPYRRLKYDEKPEDIPKKKWGFDLVKLYLDPSYKLIKKPNTENEEGIIELYKDDKLIKEFNYF